MKIKSIEIYKTLMEMNFQFVTSKAEISNRETIVIKIIDSNGNYGYGEVAAFKDPFYTNETIDISLKVLLNNYIDKILNVEIENPFKIHDILDSKYPMTKAAIEGALVDLYCKENNLKATDFIFKEEKILSFVKGGIVLGDMEYEKLKVNIKKFINEGYERFKIKIKPKESLNKIYKIRSEFPGLKLLLDANRSFLINDVDELKEYDKLNLLCIEEPIQYTNFNELAVLQNQLNTPICLDEGILNIDMLKDAIALQAFKILNIKACRLGGIYYAYEAIKICRKNNIKFWMGSMIESSIGKMVQINLARIQDNYFEGDLSSNSRYFKEDFIEPSLEFNKGIFNISNLNSFGYEVNEEKLKKNSTCILKREV